MFKPTKKQRVPAFAETLYLKLVEKGGNMSNFFVEDLERFQINMSK